MGTLRKWWNVIVYYFATLDEETIQTKGTAAKKKKTKRATKKGASKTIINPPAESVKASKAIKMITESINTETDSGKKKYKSRLSRELNNAIKLKNKEEISKSISRIVKYLNK